MHVSRNPFALLLSSVLLSASPLPGQGTPAAPEATIPKEALRYKGKSFEQWRTQLLTELTAESRLQAIKALRAFAMNRYGPETAVALIELVGTYKWRDVDDGKPKLIPTDEEAEVTKVLQAAAELMRCLGDEAHPALKQALKSTNQMRRLFTLAVIVKLDSAAFATPLVGELTGHADPLTREAAFNVLVQPGLNENTVRLLLRGLRDPCADVRQAAAKGLSKVPQNARAKLILSLLALLKEKETASGQGALAALARIKPEPEKVVPALLELLQEKPSPSSGTDSRSTAILLLGSFGPKARDAVPTLRSLLASGPCKAEAAWALGRIGVLTPEVRQALRRALERAASTKDRRLKTVAANALAGKNLADFDLEVIPPLQAPTWRQ